MESKNPKYVLDYNSSLGQFIVRNIETGQAICEPVKEGLARDILRVALSGKVELVDKPIPNDSTQEE